VQLENEVCLLQMFFISSKIVNKLTHKKKTQQIPTGTRRHDPPFFKLLLFFLSYIFQLLLSVNVDEDIDLICTVKPVLKGQNLGQRKVNQMRIQKL
jgi:hypothetical protein